MAVPIPTPCKVVHIDLAEDIPPLTPELRFNAAYIYFSYQGVPLGHRVLLRPELPLSARQLWNLGIEAASQAVTDYLTDGELNTELRNLSPAQIPKYLTGLPPLDRLAHLLRTRPEPWTGLVSVVVCTHNRPDALARCLESLVPLRHQTLEILVVDNAPATQAAEQVVRRFSGFRYEVEPRMGLSHARNRGIQCSRGEILAFTDDDVVVQPNWLSELIRPFKDRNVMCSTGLVLPAELESKWQEVFERNLTFHRGYRPRLFDSAFFQQSRSRGIPVWHIGAGANMAIRRSAFEAVGLFDTRLGAGASGCSEDTEFWYRVLSKGGCCAYTPMALVWHYHREDLQSLKHQIRMYAKGHAAALLVQFARHGHRGNIHRLFWELPSDFVRYLAGSIMYRDMDCFLATTLQGWVEGVLFYLLHAREGEPAKYATSPSPSTDSAVSAT